MNGNSGSQDNEDESNDIEDNEEAKDEEISIEDSIAKKTGLIPKEDIPRMSTKEKLKKMVEQERMLNTSTSKRLNRNNKKINATTKNITRKSKNDANKSKNLNKNYKNNKIIENVNKNITKKEKSKKSNKTSDDEWDIISCKDVIHRERKATTMKMIIFPEKIVNVRKGKGWKLEVMVQYNTGETQWTFLHGAVAEMPELTTKFMKDNKINYTLCGYNDNPKKYNKNTKITQYDDYKYEEGDDVKYERVTKVIHNNLRKKIYKVTMVEDNKETDEETILSKKNEEDIATNNSKMFTPEKLIFEEDIDGDEILEHNNITDVNNGNNEIMIQYIDVVNDGTNIQDEASKDNNSLVNNDIVE